MLIRILVLLPLLAGLELSGALGEDRGTCEYSFPDERSVGVLLVAPIFESDSRDVGENKTKLEAKGIVQFPCDSPMMLVVDGSNHHNLSFLRDNSLACIDLRYTELDDLMLANISRAISLEFIRFGPSVNDQLLCHLGMLPNLRTVDLRNSPITGEGLKCIAKQETLERVYLQGTQITDRDLMCLKSLRQLKHVSLPTQISDEGLRLVARIPRLEGIYLASTRISNSGLSDIDHCHQLKLLNLSGTEIGDEGIEYLRCQDTLEMLDLSATNVTDACAAIVGSLYRLRVLDLSETSMTAEALKNLDHLVSLNTLNLSDTHIDGGWESLKQLRKLEHLDLSGLEISSQDLEFLTDLKSLESVLIPDAEVTAELIKEILEDNTLKYFWLPQQISDEAASLLRANHWEQANGLGLWTRDNEKKR